ncbi:TRAP-type C4-dicarboxylate transport system, substrate-binding protein [Marivita hallyeonensis]|uniref:TRAP-type C4-dicarboxylate transport system, substrate-binding protein n=2 Tax=Marivita hallyeonensis TaxID=996342 RepID=A0A1M5N130_9RHOB|nr:TRAP-type C4-dicarboxylate transport system, substrate-binding protein [Marivita hallyeonensis]
MSNDVIIAGYQGPRSILTRGLTAFAEASLPSATLVPDVTADGLPAQALFDGIEMGTYAAGYMASGYLTARVPELAVLDLPFSVTDRRQAFAKLDGDLGRALSAAVARETNLVVLAFWDNGFRHITNASHPIRSPAECKGLRIRTLNNQLYQDTLTALGFEPVVTDVKELIQACETGAVHAQENPLTNMLTFGLDRWHKHVSLTGHIFGIVLLTANKDWFCALSEDDQETLLKGAADATVCQRFWAEEEDSVGLQTLKARGVEVLEQADLDTQAFRAAAERIRSTSVAKLPKEIVDLYLA